jgi:MYXO-CTERM domain-containing protein
MPKNSTGRSSHRTTARAFVAALAIPLAWPVCACSDAHPGSASTEALTAAPATPKAKSFALVLVDAGGGIDLTMAQAQRMMFGTNPTDRSFKQFYEAASFGALNITGDVYGLFTSNALGDCAFDGLAPRDPAVTSGPDALAAEMQLKIPKKYDHYIYYFGRVARCGAGLAREGAADRPAADTWLNGTRNGCVLLFQEPGHNIGLMHASSLVCPNASLANDLSNCAVSEYGNPYTPMGVGCHDLNVYEKWYEGWLDGCNGVKVTSSGTFTLLPIETGPCGGIQALQIPMPVATRATRTVRDPAKGLLVQLKNYYLELRAPVGIFDSNLKPTVLVYAADDIQPPAIRSSWSYLLDMDPGTPALDGLAQGQTFTDPAGGLSITLVSLDASKATIKVDIQGGAGAAPTCIDGTTLTAPGPESCGVGAPIDAGTTDSSSGSDSSAGDSSDGVADSPDSGSAGSGGAGASAPDAAAVPSDDANMDVHPQSQPGCACHVNPDSTGSGGVLGALAAVTMLRRARRRRNRSRL